MQIRNAVDKDISKIMDIYTYARNFMAENGNPNQWGPTNWPPEKLIKSDIEQKKSYVCTEGETIVGVFYYDYGKNIEETYQKIEGKWIGNDEYGVIHRIASGGSTKGVGTFCIKWALERCNHLRMDTHGDNKPMQNLLTKLGFQKCGIIYVAEDPFPRFAYEKCENQQSAF